MSKKGEFVAGSGREPMNISESQVRYAMENTKSNQAAASFLNVSRPTYKKYASMYFDTEKGKTLYELHKNQPGAGIARPNSGKNHGRKVSDILAGKHPEYSRGSLKRRLMKTQTIPLICSCCGFGERRIIDEKMPLLLVWKDEDYTNHKEENLEWHCYNCYYLRIGNFTGMKGKYWH